MGEYSFKKGDLVLVRVWSSNEILSRFWSADDQRKGEPSKSFRLVGTVVKVQLTEWFTQSVTVLFSYRGITFAERMGYLVAERVCDLHGRNGPRIDR